ncbi:MAG TPA: AMP-dependent synthetase/ligase [Mycobacteriales bacterium]|nr:AMP-dependent synthetase/ligase [Mycobacteriales bacterium]
MREFSVPATAGVPAGSNLTDMVYDNARSHPDAVSFSRRTDSGWDEVTAARFAAEVTDVAGGLVAAGIEPGDRVALMSRTRYEWTLFDYAIWAAGAVTVPVYETSSPEQVRWILADSGAVAAVLETAEHGRTLDGVRADLPALGQVWQIDRGAVHTLRGLGAGRHGEEISRRRAALGADDVATIIYTSGTTGRPKGCVLTHRNLLAEVRGILPGLHRLFNPDAATLLFLPLAHVFARAIQCGAVYSRCRLGYTADARGLAADLRTFRPTFLLAVPHVFNRVYNTARQTAYRDGHGGLFDRAERVAIAYSQALDTGGPSPRLRLRHRFFDALVYRKLRTALGGRCRQAISGGAPLGTRLAHFYRGIGVTVYEGYGLTETTAGACVNLDGATRIGSVGRPVPGVSVRLADDGEVWLAGDIVFPGYWNNDAATAGSLLDGWFRTGDLGELDSEGFLTITGRIKELIVTAGGKNVAPAVLEDRLRAHPLISQAMVVGDGRPYVACLVTLDEDFLPDWLTAHGMAADTPLADLRDHDGLRSEIQAAVDRANEAVSRAESIRRFGVLAADFTLEAGELTPSLKLRRNVIADHRAADIAALYPAR